MDMLASGVMQTDHFTGSVLATWPLSAWPSAGERQVLAVQLDGFGFVSQRSTVKAAQLLRPLLFRDLRCEATTRLGFASPSTGAPFYSGARVQRFGKLLLLRQLGSA
jgi:hypothetical protein